MPFKHAHIQHVCDAVLGNMWVGATPAWQADPLLGHACPAERAASALRCRSYPVTSSPAWFPHPVAHQCRPVSARHAWSAAAAQKKGQCRAYWTGAQVFVVMLGPPETGRTCDNSTACCLEPCHSTHSDPAGSTADWHGRFLHHGTSAVPRARPCTILHAVAVQAAALCAQ